MTRLIEVWGDTVDSRHLAGSIALGIGGALPVYLIADSVFPHLVANRSLAHSYALVAGLLASLIAGVVAGILIKPKRVVREVAVSAEARREALAAIIEDGGELTDPSTWEPQLTRELQALGLYETFAAEYARHMAAPTSDAEEQKQHVL